MSENPQVLVSRLPVEVRVLRSCGFCGLAILTEEEFLAWLAAPVDMQCPRDGYWRTARSVELARSP